jgi:Uma2 family endonuclease
MKPVLNNRTGQSPPHDDPPPLEPGDRLTRDEFERRYEAMPNLKKAELIEGVVYTQSRVPFAGHGKPHADLVGWLGFYRAATKGIFGGDNTTARLDLDNEPQPDAMLMIDPARGGQARITDDDYVEGAPELVAEVASSSVSFDLHTKFNVYRRCGVKEYIVWRVMDGAVDWFVLVGGAYERLQPDTSGVFKSRAFPGLWLDAQAILNGDLARVLSCVQAGIASPEHAQFLHRLTPQP